jgi:K+-transporting ATPase A subunit
MLIIIKTLSYLLNGEPMSRLSYFSQAALCSLIALCSVSIFANTTIENALHEYTTAAHSNDLNRYNQACANLKDVVKNTDIAGVELCRQQVLATRPLHFHRYVNDTFFCSCISYSAVPMTNTVMHVYGDPTACSITSKMAKIQACITTLAAAAAAIAIPFSSNERIFRNNDGGVTFLTGFPSTAAIATMFLVPLAALEWNAFYLNSKARKEKNPFDDAHQSLLRSLDAAMCKHDTSTTTGATAPVNVEKAA